MMPKVPKIPNTMSVDAQADMVLTSLKRIQFERAQVELERVTAGGAQDAVSSRFGDDGQPLTFAGARARLDDQARLLADEYAGEVWDRVVELATKADSAKADS